MENNGLKGENLIGRFASCKTCNSFSVNYIEGMIDHCLEHKKKKTIWEITMTKEDYKREVERGK